MIAFCDIGVNRKGRGPDLLFCTIVGTAENSGYCAQTKSDKSTPGVGAAGSLRFQEIWHATQCLLNQLQRAQHHGLQPVAGRRKKGFDQIAADPPTERRP